jgi:hypothetical protein
LIKHTKVRNDFLERGELKPVDRLILIYLAGRRRKAGRPWEIQRSQIARALGLGESAVKASLERLRKQGWITDNTRPHRDERGRIRRHAATLVASRRAEVIAPDAYPQVAPKVGFPPTVKQPSNERLSNKELTRPDVQTSGTVEDPWALADARAKATASPEPPNGVSAMQETNPANSSTDAKGYANDLGISLGDSYSSDDDLSEWREQLAKRRERNGQHRE